MHAGETLYMRCTSNGTHQGFDRVYSIDGESYMVEALGGKFYVGETVYLYRDADFRYAQLVGSGTVVFYDPEIYSSKGRITAMHVAQGEYVERGELLYEVIAGEDINTVAPASGIITDCNVQAGENGYAVYIAPETPPARLDMTVSVRIG